MKKLAAWIITCTVMGTAIPAGGQKAPQAPAPAPAKAAAAVKIGVIDTARIMRTSHAAKQAQAIFRKDLEAKRGILSAKEQNVRLLEEELRNPEIRLSPKERSYKNDNLAKEVKELQRLRSDLEEELKKKDAELTQKLIGELRLIVQTFSRQEQYTLIMEKSAVVAADDAIDITERIIQIFDGEKK